uniref:Uncharacterized protein n=1 Tax=Ixodes ricinus TaxID=34613 RepID=A0A6B0TZX9_IXORI
MLSKMGFSEIHTSSILFAIATAMSCAQRSVCMSRDWGVSFMLYVWPGTAVKALSRTLEKTGPGQVRVTSSPPRSTPSSRRHSK